MLHRATCRFFEEWPALWSHARLLGVGAASAGGFTPGGVTLGTDSPRITLEESIWVMRIIKTTGEFA